MSKPALKLISNAMAFYAAAAIFPAITMDTPWTGITAGLVLVLVNFLIRPLIILLTLPVNLVTLGLFTFVVNTWMVMLTDRLLQDLHIGGFWTALGAALLVSVMNMIFYREGKKH